MARAVRKSGMKEVPLSEVKESKLRAPAFAPVEAFAWRMSIPSRDAVYRAPSLRAHRDGFGRSSAESAVPQNAR